MTLKKKKRLIFAQVDLLDIEVKVIPLILCNVRSALPFPPFVFASPFAVASLLIFQLQLQMISAFLFSLSTLVLRLLIGTLFPLSIGSWSKKRKP